jgi:outer membrane receptor protein involved in Fe transport
MMARDYVNTLPKVVVVVASFLTSQPALAQSTQAEKAPEQIIVTAQRRAQPLQDVPLAVTAFNNDSLEALQVDNAADLQYVVPNFSYTATNFGGVNYTIRGIGASVLGDGADTGVALHYNGAFLQGGGNAGLYYDVEGVEVLRGPQGTLFGRNATGGAVNLRTHRPIDVFEGTFEVSVGSFDTRGAEAMLNIPINDRLFVRIAGVAENYDGDVRNITTGTRINGNDVVSGRLSVRWLPDSDTKVDFSATYLRASGDGMQAEKRLCRRDPIGSLGCLPTGLDAQLPNYMATLAGLVATSVRLIAPGFDPFVGSINPTDLRKVALDFDPQTRAKELVATLEIERRFGALTFNSITAFSTQDGSYVNDTDFAVAVGRFRPIFPGGVVPTSAPDPENLGSLAGRTIGSFDRPWSYETASGKGRQWLQEVRLASSFKGPMNFLVGAFALDYDRKEDFYQIASSLDAVGLLLGAAPPFFRLETPVADLQSYAVFGEGYFDVSDSLRLTGGLRLTRDEKQQKNRSLLFSLPQPFDTNSLRKDAVTGRLVLDWRPEVGFADDALVYASYARGYKGGGFNPQGAVQSPPTFAPEYVNAYEIGLKSRLFRSVTANAAAFYYDYEGFQVSKIVNRTSVNENIDASIWGAELEIAARLGQNWSLDLTASHLSTEIGEASSIDPRDPTGGQAGLIAVKDTDTGANCVATLTQLATVLRGRPFGNCAILGLPSGVPVSLKGNELSNSPDWTLRFGVQYETDLTATLRFQARADYAWRSDFWGRIYNRDPIDRIESWGVLNAHAQIEAADRGWFLRLEGSNLSDEDAVTGMYVTDATSGLATNLFLVPSRRVNLVLGARF